MVAQSPIQSNTLLNGQALDVTQYQPPWQALSDFAMSSNFDNDQLDPNHPEFRRLAQQVCVRVVVFFPLEISNFSENKPTKRLLFKSIYIDEWHRW